MLFRSLEHRDHVVVNVQVVPPRQDQILLTCSALAELVKTGQSPSMRIPATFSAALLLPTGLNRLWCMSLQKLFRAICVLPECCLAAEAGSVRMTADRWFRRPAPDLYLIGSLGTQPHLSVRKWTVFGSYSIFPKSFHNSLPTHSNGVRRFARI